MSVFPIYVNETRGDYLTARIPDFDINILGMNVSEILFMSRDAIAAEAIRRHKSGIAIPTPGETLKPLGEGEKIYYVDIDIKKVCAEADRRE